VNASLSITIEHLKFCEVKYENEAKGLCNFGVLWHGVPGASPVITNYHDYNEGFFWSTELFRQLVFVTMLTWSSKDRTLSFDDIHRSLGVGNSPLIKAVVSGFLNAGVKSGVYVKKGRKSWTKFYIDKDMIYGTKFKPRFYPTPSAIKAARTRAKVLSQKRKA